MLKEFPSAILRHLLQCLLDAHCSGVVNRFWGVIFVFEEGWEDWGIVANEEMNL